MSLPPTVPLDPKIVSWPRWVLSAAETGRVEWISFAICADDNRASAPRNQVTLDAGFAEGSANLKNAVQRYISKGGALSLTFSLCLTKMSSGPAPADGPGLIEALKESGRQTAMLEAQPESFEERSLEAAFG